MALVHRWQKQWTQPFQNQLKRANIKSEALSRLTGQQLPEPAHNLSPSTSSA